MEKIIEQLEKKMVDIGFSRACASSNLRLWLGVMERAGQDEQLIKKQLSKIVCALEDGTLIVATRKNGVMQDALVTNYCHSVILYVENPHIADSLFYLFRDQVVVDKELGYDTIQ